MRTRTLFYKASKVCLFMYDSSYTVHEIKNNNAVVFVYAGYPIMVSIRLSWGLQFLEYAGNCAGIDGLTFFNFVILNLICR